MKEKVYIETSIISYLTGRDSQDPLVFGRQEITRQWWEHCRQLFEIVASELVVSESQSGDPQAAKRRVDLLTDFADLKIVDPAIVLAEALVRDGPIPRQYGEDALHIALCAVNGIDYLLTWNCKHLANAAHRHQIEAVVEQHGYRCPVICTPEELLED